METFQADGREASGYLALPQAGQGAGVLVLHPWWGLNEFIRGFCDRLAGEGFVVFAPDLYDGRTATTIEEAEQLSGSLDFEATIPVVTGAADYLREHTAVRGTQIGVIGFSMGAAWALLLTAELRPDDMAAVVLFYGNYPGIGQDNSFAKTRAAFLGHFAEDDPYEDVADMEATRQDLERAGREVTFYTYPETGHWFFEADRPDAYKQTAAELAWQRTLGFLKEMRNEK
jgi:carboxymethylenebutenolidase